MNLSLIEFRHIQKYIESQCGISLGENKAYLIETRLPKLLQDNGICSFDELCTMINSNRIPAKISEKIVDAITTNETLWFRDKTPWIILENVLMPGLIDDLRCGKKNRIRIWSAGCSTGQEPYSIAMVIENYLEQHGIQDVSLRDFEITATDISYLALADAEAGCYDNISISRGLPDLNRMRYFKYEKEQWRIDQKIRNAVHFSWFNLQNRFSSLGKFDVIFCRYVLIYFSNSLKNSIHEEMARCLQQKGNLFLGSSELYPEYDNYFEMKNYRDGIYYEVKQGKTN
jgi:chemotaxis protein methyltransferase CheR